MVSVFFFFFKQKTAYELRISDWSSDVCSSDLLPCLAILAACCLGFGPRRKAVGVTNHGAFLAAPDVAARRLGLTIGQPTLRGVTLCDNQIGRASCRERGCQYV